jgi:hypothetical protein
LRTTVPPLFLICGILVVSVILVAFPVPAAAQGNPVENGDFSQGLEHWIVEGRTNPCVPSVSSYPTGGCVIVTDEGTPGNPHLELWNGIGGEKGVTQLVRLPKDVGRITLSLRVWSLGNTSYVRTLIHTQQNDTLTLEGPYKVQYDWYESYHYPSREPTTITRDITNFHNQTTYLLVAGDQVAVDDIAIVAAPPSPEPLLMHQTELIKNPHLELLTGIEGSLGLSQEVHLPEDATRISLSIKAWALTPPGQNPENVIPSVEVRITHDGSISNVPFQETYSFSFFPRMEPAITITRDLTGFKGKNITLTLFGEEAAVDDVSVLATRSYFGFPTTEPGLFTVAAIILAAVLGGFLGLRHVRRARNYQNGRRQLESRHFPLYRNDESYHDLGSGREAGECSG